eukprot:6147529-Amphidinium_carterae.1
MGRKEDPKLIPTERTHIERSHGFGALLEIPQEGRILGLGESLMGNAFAKSSSSAPRVITIRSNALR